MKSVILTGIVIIVTVLSGTTGYTLFKNNNENYKSSNTILVNASWEEEFSDIESLIKNSELIVVAELDNELESYQPFEGYTDTFTDATIKIEQVLKGNYVEPVIVSQYGGIRKDKKIEKYEDLPLMEKGKKYLLFLEKIKDTTDRNNKYQYIGGIQGFYLLEGQNNDFTIDAPEKAGLTQKVSNLKFNDLREKVNKAK